MGKLDGKVALVTGAGRGQGRSHAIGLAEEGADVIALDICASVESIPYPMSDPEDLRETERLVRDTGSRVFSAQVDVRDLDAMTEAVDAAVAELGRLDIVVANAGVESHGRLDAMSEQTWRVMIDVNLTGVWTTVRASVNHVVAGGEGGSIVLISSVVGLTGMEHIGHYVAAKHGVTGLGRTLAQELAQHRIRVNSIHPTNCRTDMLLNVGTRRLFRPDLDEPSVEDVVDAMRQTHLLDVPWVEPHDITEALLYLVSDSGRYVTGIQLPIDAGLLAR